jgi:hypothetical protein
LGHCNTNHFFSWNNKDTYSFTRQGIYPFITNAKT